MNHIDTHDETEARYRRQRAELCAPPSVAVERAEQSIWLLAWLCFIYTVVLIGGFACCMALLYALCLLVAAI